MSKNFAYRPIEAEFDLPSVDFQFVLTVVIIESSDGGMSADLRLRGQSRENGSDRTFPSLMETAGGGG